MKEEKLRLKDKRGEMSVTISEDWVFIQRDKSKPDEPPVFIGMEPHIIKEIASHFDIS